jgi:hypothetical protein
MITYVDIDSLEKAQELRVLRNECAEWMTGDTGQISPEQQEKFYREKLVTGLVEGYLAYDGDEPVAYGLLVWDDEHRVWSSHGVKTTRRGAGIGGAISVENAKRAHAQGVPIWAEVRRDNGASQKITRAAGYKLLDTYERDGITIDLFCCEVP